MQHFYPYLYQLESTDQLISTLHSLKLDWEYQGEGEPAVLADEGLEAGQAGQGFLL